MKKDKEDTSKKFIEVKPDDSGVTFKNNLTEGPNTNILMYEYFYNGGGVAVADFNNDGLDDIYFTANIGDNALYLNLGNMKFKDVTSISGASGRPGPWKTGVTVVDINADGLLDLYICYSGMLPEEKRKNQLFINQGISTNGTPLFKDKAEEYGIDSPGYSNQAYFFDYDKDDDLDMLLLNHNPKNLPILSPEATKDMLSKDDAQMGLRLFKQNNQKFNDVTQSSGINGSALSYGLGLGISDLNGDGYLDFYVSNDYTVPDYLYINNKNGTFTNEVAKQLSCTSQFSMGNDLADINNDGLVDIFTLDMLPEDNKRQKLLLGADNYGKFEQNIKNGFHYQYMRNMLHINNGNNAYSEIAQLSGISNTDWSWSALFADYDNDGYKDLFVTNGYLRDYTNMDFIKYMENFIKEKGKINKEDVLSLVQKMPASDVSNYIFKNNGDLTFKNTTNEWGIQKPINSNGAAYSDLDNDGDLDLVVNNVNKQASILQNNSPKGNYIQLQLIGNKGNTLALGAKAMIYSKDNLQVFEQQITRGYQSSVSPIMHIGLKGESLVDSIKIVWPDQQQTTMTSIKANQKIKIEYDKSEKQKIKAVANPKSLFAELPSIKDGISTKNFRDFDRQPLLTRELSHAHSAMAVGDLNNDGIEDLFVGGNMNVEASIYLQSKNESLKKINSPIFAQDKKYHDADAEIADIDGDGDNDIIVASGGYHDLMPNDERLEDRIYINDGKTTFTKMTLPSKNKSSKSCIAIGDINGDGKNDIFIGARFIAGRYPEIPFSNLYINQGNGNFTQQEMQLGMVTDAVITDLDLDKKNELILVGEYMPISVFNYDKNTLTATNKFFDKSPSGWWASIKIEDLNNDGRPDIIAGNEGLNTQVKAIEGQEVEMIYGDFDDNGSVDPLLNFYIQGVNFPYIVKEELGVQLPKLSKKYTDFKSYSDVTTKDLFSNEIFKNQKFHRASNLKTAIFISQSNYKYSSIDLPIQAQFSPVHTILIKDINNDQKKDIVLAGNEEYYKIRLGRNNSNHGTVLINKGNNKFEFMNNSGLNLTSEIRSSSTLGNLFLFKQADGVVRIYR